MFKMFNSKKIIKCLIHQIPVPLQIITYDYVDPFQSSHDWKTKALESSFYYKTTET